MPSTAPGTGMVTEVNADSLASMYLTTLGAPNTTENRRALSAWFLAESARGSTPGTIKVVGNNPLNLTGTGSGGSRSYVGHSFAVYNSPQEGATAWANTLHSTWGQHYGYNNIAASFVNNSGNGAATIAAINNSGWRTGKTGGAGAYGSLLSIYNSVSGKSGTSEPNIFNIPNGTVLTESEIQMAVDYLNRNHKDLLGNDPIAQEQANTVITQLLQSHKGETWSPQLAATLQGQFGTAAKQANPLNTQFAFLQPLATLAGDLTDTQKWGYTLAIIAGGGIIVIGALIITKGALFPSNSGKQPAPIVVTE